MKAEKFKKKLYKSGQNPVDYFNENPNLELIFERDKSLIVNENKVTQGKILVAEFESGIITIYDDCAGLPVNEYTPFQVLSKVRFNNDYRNAIQFIELTLFNEEIPYIRVGTNYFKRISKKNRYGVELSELKVWNKDTIKQDHGAELLNRVHLFDDFTIEPNNISYTPTVGGYWNLYEPFPHKLLETNVTTEDFKTTAAFMAHVFGEQIELGYKYMKVLFEYPKQILPVLTLVSKERMTGKTTFLNWLDMIFGNNYVMVTPDDIVNSFNSTYAYKNIIGIDEAVVDRTSAVEKIKSIATANTMTVNEKMIAQYRIPFFGKLIITTNREKDFMKVDSEEIRFWVRKIGTIPADKLTTDYEGNLLKEIPAFLTYLCNNIQVEFGKSRMVFTAEEIANKELDLVKRESYSGLRKELTTLLSEFFNENQDKTSVFAGLKDIKEFWFDKDSRISTHYIKKVLSDEMGYQPLKMSRFIPLNGTNSKTGTPYQFDRKDFVNTPVKQEIEMFTDDLHPEF